MKKVSKETLALVNKVDDINQTLADGGVSCLRYSEVEEMMDALNDVIKLFDLKRQGGACDWGDDKGKYERKHWSDYVAPTDPKAFDESKVKEDDDA
tara:strand:- start:710 stop:997 length:288 start_codon:yes stop_codon:yes gene_type:complete